MTARERFLAAISNAVPDRVPVTPDISNYIPCKLTGLPFWEIYFKETVPLWQAYLAAADHFGIEAWIGSCTNPPLLYGPARFEQTSHCVFQKDRDAMLKRTVTTTPDGTLSEELTCFRHDPPSPTEKPIKNFARDFQAFKWLLREPTGIDLPIWHAMRDACLERDQAFGVCVSYPGFQHWSWSVNRGVELLAYAEMDTPELLEEWREIDHAIGVKTMELLIAARPDYILFGGSGTITLASPALARKYAIPSIKVWSRMAKEAGIPTMLHSCGKSRALVQMLVEETDVTSVNPLEEPPMGDIDLAEVKAACGARIGLMGNLHTTEVMLHGTPAHVKEKSIAAMRAAGQGGGFVLSSGDQCGYATPDENLFAMVEAGHEYGVYDMATGRLATPA